MGKVYQPFFKKQIDINDWLGEVIELQFDKKYGSLYWLDQEKKLGIDAKKDIKETRDLSIFGNRNSDFLRWINVEDLMPQLYQKEKGNIKVYETGGTLGNASRIGLVDYWRLQGDWLSFFFDLNNIPKGENIVWIGPTGGRTTLDYFRRLAEIRNGICYFVDFDSRWIKYLIRNNDYKTYNEYMEHLKRQIISVFETQDIGVVLTTPKLFEVFYHDIFSKYKKNFKGIFYGGTSMSVDMHEMFLNDFYKGIPQIANYGNTLMGVALSPVWTEESGYDLTYYPYMPYFYIDIVGFNEPNIPVKYGDLGQVKFSTIHKELFLPNMLERDQAIRIKPNNMFQWDGVANVMPLSTGKVSSETKIIEGVY